MSPQASDPSAVSVPIVLPAAPEATGWPALRGQRVVFAANTSWYLHNHHRRTLRAFLDAGAIVHAVSPDGPSAGKLEEMGCLRTHLPMKPSSRNLVDEARAAAAFRRIYKTIRPHLAFHFTIKCNLYGGLAAARLGIPAVNNICGLGSAFSGGGPLNRLAQETYRFIHKRTARVFFQNLTDFETMRERGLVSESQSLLLPGSGVDLDRFAPAERAASSAGPTFVYAGRLLREKGLSELAEAMRRVHAEFPQARCLVYGFTAPGDARYVTRRELDRWTDEGVLEYAGILDDVRPAYAEAECVVLPTYYREGVPKSLLEAAAMGVPAVATDLPGCRAAVVDGVTGHLCTPRDPASLADAMLRMIRLGPEGRARMGRAGRARVEASFSEERVRRAFLDTACALLG